MKKPKKKEKNIPFTYIKTKKPKGIIYFKRKTVKSCISFIFKQLFLLSGLKKIISSFIVIPLVQIKVR